jgi:hypothetical protein
VKVVGGAYYGYTLRGDGQPPLRRVPAAEQRVALAAALRTIEPQFLKLPRTLLDIVPPRPFGYAPHRELFGRYTGLTFDAVAPAATAADMTLSLLLDEDRAARLVQQQAIDPSLPGFDHVLDIITRHVMDARASDEYEAEIARAVQRVYVDRLTDLAARASMPQVRALAHLELVGIADALAPARGGANEQAHRALLAADIRRFMDRPAEPVRYPSPPTVPPGQPIGMLGMDWLDLRCDGW